MFCALYWVLNVYILQFMYFLLSVVCLMHIPDVYYALCCALYISYALCCVSCTYIV